MRALLLLPLLVACTEAQVSARNDARSLYIGDCDLMALRARAVTIVDNADPDFAGTRDQYRMELFRRSPPAEIVLFHTPRDGGARGGGYTIAFDAQSCKLARLTPQRRGETLEDPQ